MANPQAENGHVDIANEIMEALIKYRIPGEQMQCLLFVIRKTYGWKKIEDEISLTQFQDATGLSRRAVVRALNCLVSKKVLGRDKKDTSHANKYKFNKDFEQWETRDKKDTRPLASVKKDTFTSDKKVTPVGTKKTHTKDTPTKDTIKRHNNIFAPPSIDEVRAYCQERKNNVDPEKWIDYYTSNGWRVGKNPMRDWKAAVRTWEKNNYAGPQNGGSGGHRESWTERVSRESKESDARVRTKLGLGPRSDIPPGKKIIDITPRGSTGTVGAAIVPIIRPSPDENSK